MGSNRNIFSKTEFSAKFCLRKNQVSHIYFIKRLKNHQKSFSDENFQKVTVALHVTELTKFDRIHLDFELKLK